MQTQSELGMEMLVLIQDMELAERKLEKQLESHSSHTNNCSLETL